MILVNTTSLKSTINLHKQCVVSVDALFSKNALSLLQLNLTVYSFDEAVKTLKCAKENGTGNSHNAG